MRARTTSPDGVDELRHGKAHDWQPTAQQELLLGAALARGPEVIRAWQAWLAAVDFEQVDYSSMQILPEVYRNLQREGCGGGPQFGRLKGIWRQSWYRNQIVLYEAATLMRDLAAAGVPVMLVAGAALALRYPPLAARPLEDLGILIAMPDRERALGHLHAAGWRAPEPGVPEAMPRFTRLLGDRGQSLEVHWRLLLGDGAASAEEDLWRAASPIEWQGARVLVLDPAHQLLHLCAHGVPWQALPPLRWIVDAAAILDVEAATLDWGKLVQAACRHQVSLRTLRGLAYLHQHLELAVPLQPLQELAGSRHVLHERFEQHVIYRSPGLLLGGLPARAVRWLRLTSQQGWLARIAGFPAFLGEDLGCRRSVDLLRLFRRDAPRRLRAFVRGKAAST